jgi:segregation and condensation protein A
MTEIHSQQSATPPSYEVHTAIFEGPLDLLLRLIEKNELDITKVALAQVTDAFMEEVDRMKADMQIELIADFLFIAAKLLWIKSRALLPKPPASARDLGDEDDIGDELIRQLRAYRQYREAANWLRDRDRVDLRSYVRGSYPARPVRITLELGSIDLEELREAAETALLPAESPRPEQAIQRIRISVVQQITLIRQRLERWAKVSFRRLLSGTPSRLEAVVTLQAILELMKQEAVAAEQEKPFGDITIRALIPPQQIAIPGQVHDETPQPPG